MEVVYSLASGALGAVIVAVAWVLSHTKLIGSVLAVLPTVAKDVEAARSAIEKHLDHQPSAPVPAPAPVPTAPVVPPTVPPTA